MINKVWMGIGCLLLSFSVIAESVDETKSASGDGNVEINVVRGEVTVRGWDRDAIRVVGELDEDLKEFVFDVDGDEAIIQVKIKETAFGWSNPDPTDIEVFVPQSSRLRVAGVSTDVDTREVKGEVSIGLVSGDVYLEGYDSRIHVSTVSGDVELHEASSKVRIKTVSGEIESHAVSGDVQYNTVSGDIVIYEGGDDLELESVSGDIQVRHNDVMVLGGHSVSGDIDVRAELKENGSIEFDSMSGSIRLVLSGDINATFDIETGSGGIRNRVTDDKPRISRYMGDEMLNFSVGNGTGQVTLTTRSGDISLQHR